MSIAALVLGIVSVVMNLILGCIPFVGQIICIILGVLAIVFAVLAMKKAPEKKGLNIAGLVLGIVGVAWAGIALIVCSAAWAAAGSSLMPALNELRDELQNMNP